MTEHRLFGPPGTGKTTFLNNQATKWADEYGKEQIIAASFTRAAAAEIASRDSPLEFRQIGTLHSFAFEACDGPEMVVSHIRDFNDEHPTYALSGAERGDNASLDEPSLDRAGQTEGDKLLNRVEVLRARMVPVSRWSVAEQGFWRSWAGWKSAHSLLDFTDLIEVALANTTHAPESPAVGLFDEVQDFTPLELALVRRWSRTMREVLLAGDDDQCLYDFKGATPDAFLDPPIPDEQKRVLGQSYRVPRAVHAVSSAWVEQLTRREPKVYRPRDDDGRAYRVAATWRDPTRALDDAATHLADGRTVMFLTTCGYMLDPIKAELRHRGVPFHNPYRVKRGDWNPLRQGTEKRRTVVDRVLAFLRLQAEVWGDDARWYTGQDMRDWCDALKTDNLMPRAGGGKTRALAFPGAEDVKLSEFLDIFGGDVAVLDACEAGDVVWYRHHLLATKVKTYDLALRVAELHGGKLLREPPATIIGTVHSVKGGQADVVYLFPDLAPRSAEGWHIGGQARDSVVRQMYVGMTRAKHELAVCEPCTTFSLDPVLLLRGASAA